MFDDISDPWHRGNLKSAQLWEGMWRKSSQLLWWVLQTLPSQRRIFLTFQFWTFHISVFVNTTAMVVNSYTILYMCMKVIICQSDRSPERLMISQTPGIGGTSNQLRWEKEWGGNPPNFWGEFCKTLPSQKSIFLTFQFWTFHISVFVNTTAMVVKSYTILYMCMKVIICQSDRSPEWLMISQTPGIGGTSNQLSCEKECGGNPSSFWG